MADFPKKQQQCLIPKYLLDYTTELNKNHPDPTDPWGGSGGDVNIEAGTGITITTESDDTKVISLDTNPDTFEVTADTGMTLEVENSNPVYTDAKLQMAYTGATRLEGTLIDLYASNGMYFHSDSAPSYVNNTTHEYKTLATTDQLFSGDYDDLYNKPTIPDAVSGTNDGTNWTSLTIGNDTYGLAGGGTTYNAGQGIDITNDTISVDTSVVALKNDLSTVATSGLYNDLNGKPDLSGMTISVKRSEANFYNRVFNNWPNVIFIDDVYGTGSYLPVVGNNSPGYGDDLLFRDADAQTNVDLASIAVRVLHVKVNNDTDIDTISLSNDYNDLINTPIIPDTTYMVTTNTNQTISASKTFGNYYNNITLDTSNNNIKVVGSMGRSTLSKGQLENIYTDVSPNGHQYDLIVDTNGIKYQLDNDYSKFTGVGFETPTNHNDLVFPDKSGTLAVTSDIITSYNDLTDKPTIPTTTSQLTNNSGFITNTVNNLTNYTLTSNLATVATTGDYDDLTNKPTIPTVPTNVSAFTNDAGYITGITSSDVTTALGYTPYNSSNPAGYITGITSSDVTTALGYTPGTSNFSGDYDDLTDKPDLSIYAQSANLATVATSGSYNDLSNKPTIPTVNDNTITITQGGVTKGSFTLNQNTNQTINVDDVPGMIGEVLFNNASGSTDLTLTMAHSFADYSYVDIQWLNNDGITNSTRVYEPNGKRISVINMYGYDPGNPEYINKAGIFDLSGTSMTQVCKVQGTIRNNSNSGVDYKSSSTVDALIKITKVVGYKQNSSPIVIPTTATSTSTVNPTNIQLTFTYTDDTTETVTLMTAATVSTTTTLS